MSIDIAALQREADRLLASGDFDQAIRAHEALLEHDPGDNDTAYNLAWMFNRVGRWEEAEAVYRKLTEMAGGFGEDALLGLSAVLLKMRRESEAADALMLLLKRNPQHLGAWLNLGRLHEDRGDRKEAAESYRKAHELAPGEALPLARYLDVLTPSVAKSDAMTKARAVLSSGSLPHLDRCDIGFALARALDEDRKFAPAWQTLLQANSSAQVLEAGSGRAFDAAAQTGRTSRTMETFQTFDPRAHAKGAVIPVFICGLYRSGSSLHEQVLSRHSRIAAGGELEVMSGIVSQLKGYPECVPQLSPEDLDRLRSQYLDGIAPLVQEADFVIDKSPENFLHLGLIRALFPQSPVIDTRRGRDDNLLSAYFQHLKGRDYANSPESLAIWYREYVRLMDFWDSRYPAFILKSDYEWLVTRPRQAVEALLTHIGVDFEDACLAPEQSDASVRTASVWQVREKIHPGSVGRSANYPEFVELVKQTLAS